MSDKSSVDGSSHAHTLVLVPAYNEQQTIASVVQQLQGLGCRVCVIDDGSSDGTSSILRECGCVVLRHAINRGQGAAIQTGIEYAKTQDADYIVTFDADGQHMSADIATLVKPIMEGRAEVVFGSRFLGQSPGIPRTRRLLLRAAALITRLLTRLDVTDTHNGLRAFSFDAVCDIKLRADGMAHASEFYDQVAKSKRAFLEAPVTVRYTSHSLAKGQRTMHALRVGVQYLTLRIFR